MECDADDDDDMPMDEKESNDEDRNADPTIQPVPVAEEDTTSNAAAAAAARTSSPFCCPQPETEPEALFPTTEQLATTVPDAAAGGDFCCVKNSGEEHDPHYVKSNLQLPEGFDDEHDMSFHDIMNKGSLIDADESVMTSNAEDPCDPMLNNKERAMGKVDVLGSRRRFRWTMLLCCLLHVALITLIIVVAKNQRKNEQAAAGAPAVPETDQEENTMVPTMLDSEETTEEEFTTWFPRDQDTQAPQEVIEPACVDTVEVSSSCYAVNTEILVFFRACFPRAGDWLGIYETAEDSTNLLDSDAYDWSFTCGSTDCTEIFISDVVPFAATGLLEEGTVQSPLYRIHMMREGDGPFEAIASSAEFRVLEDEGSC